MTGMLRLHCLCGRLTSLRNAAGKFACFRCGGLARARGSWLVPDAPVVRVLDWPSPALPAPRPATPGKIAACGHETWCDLASGLCGGCELRVHGAPLEDAL